MLCLPLTSLTFCFSFYSLCWHWHVAVFYLTSNKTIRPLVLLYYVLWTNCIPKHDRCLHSQVWQRFVILKCYHVIMQAMPYQPSTDHAKLVALCSGTWVITIECKLQLRRELINRSVSVFMVRYWNCGFISLLVVCIDNSLHKGVQDSIVTTDISMGCSYN